jgi:hypothetical protein
MQSFLKIGLVACLSLSSFSLLGCSDDDSDNEDPRDSGTTRPDAGVTPDAAVPNLDSGLPQIDAGLGNDAGARDGGGDAAAAPGHTYNLQLTTTQESPVCAGAGASAEAVSKIVLSADETTLDVNVAYSGLSGPVTGGHIHSGAPGVSGPVVLPFAGSLASPILLTLTGASYKAAEGAPPTFAAFVEALKAGNSYVNLHTAACPGGELRGQIK